jgi:hypothetical protein
MLEIGGTLRGVGAIGGFSSQKYVETKIFKF